MAPGKDVTSGERFQSDSKHEDTISFSESAYTI